MTHQMLVSLLPTKCEMFCNTKVSEYRRAGTFETKRQFHCCRGMPRLKLWCICEYSRTPNRARRCIWLAGISSSTIPCRLDVLGLPPAREPCCCDRSFDRGPFGRSRSLQPCTGFTLVFECYTFTFRNIVCLSTTSYTLMAT